MSGVATQEDLDEFDGRASELSSSVGAMTRTSRSNSFADGMVVSGHGHGHGYSSAAAALERGSLPWEFVQCRRRPRRPSQRWHEDSRLEFLLRNRDRFATESECDRMSHCSHPASLDEGALYPGGGLLENRFSYLFDSPHSSRVQSTLASVAASQATADDDAERLGTQWDDFEEWRTLTEELEKTETELQMWKAKAEELEEALAHGAGRQALRKELIDAPGPKSPPLAAKVAAASAGAAAAPPLRHQRSAGSEARERGASDLAAEATAPAVCSWRYLVLLVLVRRQLDLQQSPLCARHVARRPSDNVRVEAARLNAVVPTVERSFSMPRLEKVPADHPLQVQVEVAAGALTPHRGADRRAERDEQMHAERSPSPEVSTDVAMGFESWNPPQAQAASERTRRRAPLHVNFDARYKRNMSDSATQTAPAITLSNMFGSMMPRYRERELARLRQENHFLRMRVASLAMSQPLTRPPSVRHQSTQTAPAITQTVRSTSRQQQAAKPAIPSQRAEEQLITRLSLPEPRLPSQVLGYSPQTPEMSRQLTDRGGLSECVQAILEESLTAFVQAVEAQSQRQKAYRATIQGRCQRAVQTLWPRSSVELYGSFASGLALPSSGLDLVIYPHRSDLSRDGLDYDRLPPIGEDGDTLRSSLDEVSPGHPSAVPSLSTGWQQQLSCRLAQEKFVLSDSIRITAHAAIPSLTFITAPEDAVVSPPPPGQEEEPLPCPIRVDISLEDPNHRGLRSKAIINWLLNEYPYARPVTLVLKQWLLERTFGMSHTGGLCSYGLLLMVVGFLQRNTPNSAAAALVGCLNFYGRRFDPRLYGVSVARCAFLHRKTPMTWPAVQEEYTQRGFCPGPGEFASLPRKLSLTGEEAHRFDPLWIEDPLNPTNNVGRNCFRIRQIQRALAHAAEALTASEASSQLRTILRVESHGGVASAAAAAELPSSRGRGAASASSSSGAGGGGTGGGSGERDEVEAHKGWQYEARWREVSFTNRALHEDLYQSLVEHPPNLIMPLPQHALIARSHLPQQWDSAVRYAGRPRSRSRC